MPQVKALPDREKSLQEIGFVLHFVVYVLVARQFSPHLVAVKLNKD